MRCGLQNLQSELQRARQLPGLSFTYSHLIMNNFLIQWDTNRSCYEFLGGFFTYKEAIRRRDQVKSHFNYKGQDLEIVSAYELGYLEAIS